MPSHSLQNKPSHQLVWIGLFAVFLGWFNHLTVFVDAENWIEEQRSAFFQRSATGQFIFLGIDSQSITEVGVWPWPRTVHADVINRLIAMNVREIGVDIDFSSASTPENDEALAQAFENANGTITLPIFVQNQSAGRHNTDIAISRPLAQFIDLVWLAAVNVAADDDGLIRSFPNEILAKTETIPSLPVALSGFAGRLSGDININYSINPNTIPVYSVSDLLAGKLDQSHFENKTVIYGAQAVELGDNFAVPVHRTLSGALVQILAAETLAQNINIKELRTAWGFLGLFVVIAALLTALTQSSFITKIMSLLALACILEIGAFFLFTNDAINLETVGFLIFIFASAVIVTLNEIGFQHFQTLFAKTDQRNTQRLLDQVIEDNVCGILVIDAQGKILKNNSQARSFFPNDLSNTQDATLDVPREFANLVQRTMSDPTNSLKGEINVHNAKNHALTLEYAVTTSVLRKFSKNSNKATSDETVACVTVWDVTERREQERKLRYFARFDKLTGALRRAVFETEIDKNSQTTIFAVNLNRFKTINVNLGRTIGDQVLIQTVERLKCAYEAADAVARLSGDTFAMSFARQMTQAEITAVFQAITKSLTAPFQIGQAEIYVGVRVGVATTSEVPVQDLLTNAEIALDEARKTQGNTLHIHKAELSEKQAYFRRIDTDLWRALERDEFWLAYQPQIDLESETLAGVEALIRWDHPELGLISPDKFIDIAEANGFVDLLGEWVLNKACEDALALPDPISVAVNVSPAQFIRSDIPVLVQRALDRTGLAAGRLHLEITEVGFLEATHTVISDLKKLDEMGICLALDDFGTGFSSFGYFASFPIRKIKVDQMFVKTLEPHSDNETIIRSVKTLSEGLNLKMICEGVETEKQLTILKEIGVHEGQGYLFGKPQKIESLIALTRVIQKIRA